MIYCGKIAEHNTHLVRNAGLAGDREITVSERDDQRTAHSDSVRLELETDTGVTSVEDAVVLENRASFK
jgi:hypothetical protein